nr:helix-turn-helix transcriptional regulator [uncultured Cohaesibacter sp.]
MTDRSKTATQARHKAWFAAYVDEGKSTHAIAAAWGLKNHTTIYNGIMAHARRRGMRVARLDDLRAARPCGPVVDWSDFSWHVRRWRERLSLSENAAAARIGISRTALRNAEAGRNLESVILLAICSAISLNPLLFFSIQPDKESCHDNDQTAQKAKAPQACGLPCNHQ